MNPSKDKFRKPALLVASLDEAAARRLLKQMGPAMAERVMAAVAELGPIDPEESKAVIAEFLQGQGASQEPKREAAVEVAFSPAARRQAAQPAAAIAEGSRGRFGFLHEMTGETIARALASESPQTAAVVLSHLPPAQAAEVLAHSAAERQTDLLRRVADLGETQPDILAEIEQHLQNLFADQLRSQRRRREGAAAVSAIVAAAGPFEGAEWLARLARTDRDLATAVRHKQRATANPTTEATAPPATIPISEGRRGQSREAATNQASGRGFVGTKQSPAESPLEFRDLEQLDNRSLALLLRSADPQIALMALTGASRSLVNRILQELSTSDADLLEQRMQRIGPVRLRDMEAAQQALAQLAREMAERREIKLPARERKLAMVA